MQVAVQGWRHWTAMATNLGPGFSGPTRPQPRLSFWSLSKLQEGSRVGPECPQRGEATIARWFPRPAPIGSCSQKFSLRLWGLLGLTFLSAPGASPVTQRCHRGSTGIPDVVDEGTDLWMVSTRQDGLG